MTAASSPEPPDPKLVIIYGDCELYGECGHCGASFGMIKPDKSLDEFQGRWEHHAMLICPVNS